MKRKFSLILILCVLSIGGVIAQDTIFMFTPHNDPIVHHTESRDSLFIYNNTMGRLIQEIWVDDPIDHDGYSPVIVMVPTVIVIFRKKLEHAKNEQANNSNFY